MLLCRHIMTATIANRTTQETYNRRQRIGRSMPKKRSKEREKERNEERMKGEGRKKAERNKRKQVGQAM